MSQSFTAACLQTNTTADLERNLAQIGDLVRQAVDRGADLIALPEACDFLHEDPEAMKAYARPVAEHAALAKISEMVKAAGCWTLIGSLTVRHENGSLANRSFVLSPAGEVTAHYDKIHMFDANIPGDEAAKESYIYHPGDQACLAVLPQAVLGLSICYDLRFPYLYRSLAHAGADILTVPAAFARMTGEAHWHVLLRARAIEAGAFVIAPAQTGHHYAKRYSYGHSLIVGPWGEVLADGGEDVGVTTARIDLEEIGKARAVISSIHHDRAFRAPARVPDT